MFIIRDARPSDFQELKRLSAYLNTLNLPHRDKALRAILRDSEASFAGCYVHNKAQARYLFVAENLRNGCLVGASRIFARHGTAENPHVYLQEAWESVRSKSLGLNFKRKYYQFKTDRRGYTEIGGLVLLPRYRNHQAQLGRQLSFIRFMYMKAHPQAFLRRVIAELLPPLHHGHSRLWDYFGAKLTQLPYHKADLLSFSNKEFILKLFPRSRLYEDMLPTAVREDMGQTGPGSQAAQRILEKIGFTYAGQVDPFDGGPHFIASRSKISVYSLARRVDYTQSHKKLPLKKYFILAQYDKQIRAAVLAGYSNNKTIHLSLSSISQLKLRPNQKVMIIPW